MKNMLIRSILLMSLSIISTSALAHETIATGSFNGNANIAGTTCRINEPSGFNYTMTWENNISQARINSEEGTQGIEPQWHTFHLADCPASYKSKLSPNTTYQKVRLTPVTQYGAIENANEGLLKNMASSNDSADGVYIRLLKQVGNGKQTLKILPPNTPSQTDGIFAELKDNRNGRLDLTIGAELYRKPNEIATAGKIFSSVPLELSYE